MRTGWLGRGRQGAAEEKQGADRGTAGAPDGRYVREW